MDGRFFLTARYAQGSEDAKKIFAFRWKDAEAKRLAACGNFHPGRGEAMFLESSFFPAFQNLPLGAL
jgi:hypothetical protein